MQENRRVGLVLSTYNSAEYVSKCLLSCLDQDYPDVVVVVTDDGSTDHTLDVLRQIQADHRNLHLIPLPHGERGVARIAAIDKAKELNCHYVVVLDSDMVLKSGLVTACVSWLEQNPGVGALVIPEIPFSDFQNYWSKVKVFERTVLNNAGTDWGRNSIEAARFWRMDAYESTGGFNPAQISFEEIQPSIRYFENGGTIKRAVFTGLYHDEKYVTLSNLLAKKRYYFSVMDNTLSSESRGVRSALERFYFFRPVLYRKENLESYLRHPLLAVGMMVMYLTLTFVGVTEVLKSRLARKKA